MKLDAQSFKREIQRRLEVRFPGYPVAVENSPVDTRTFWVQVSSVPKGQEAVVVDEIYRLQEQLAPTGEYMLLPMTTERAVWER